MKIALRKVNRELQLGQSDISEIIQMALSDHVAFDDIYRQFGLKETDVNRLDKLLINAS